METITEESQKKKDKYLVAALLVAVAFSLMSLFILVNKLEIMETNYDVLTREVRLLENRECKTTKEQES